ncbi:MAG: hypothetical protein P8O09_04105 [Flavobacteriaceae bacterium]|nr:hypothetical protein [Flavobacteriaceae bacterium]
MKKITYLLTLSIIFQSCMSTKFVDYNDDVFEDQQKLRITLVDRTSVKGQLVSKNETEIVLANDGGTKTIPREQISNIKIKQFSVGKTFGFAGGTLAVAGSILIIALLFAIAGA